MFSLRADGFGWADASVVFEELGRAVVPGPLVWSYLAHDGSPADGVVGGIESAGRRAPWLVEHLDALDALLVLDDGGVRLVDRRRVDGASALDWPLDPSPRCTGSRRSPPATAVGAERPWRCRWRRQGAVLTAAFLRRHGPGARADLAVAYAKERAQFDRPIGSFQAVKHLLADMVVRAEVARAAVYAAACTLDDPDLGDLDRAVSGAKLLAGEAAIDNGKSATQVHGGMGFTWEVDVHLYLKRAWVLDTQFGSVDHHADAVASSLAVD